MPGLFHMSNGKYKHLGSIAAFYAASFVALCVMVVPLALPVEATGKEDGTVSSADSRASGQASSGEKKSADSGVAAGAGAATGAGTFKSASDVSKDSTGATSDVLAVEETKPSADGENLIEDESGNKRLFTPVDVTGGDSEAVDTQENAMVRLQNEAVQHFEQSQFYMSKWDMELAEVELRAAIMYMPTMKAAHRDYCLVALLRGKPLRALAEFMMVVGLGDPIPLSEEQVKELQDTASALHYNKGLTYADKGDWDEAVAELRWSLSYTPEDPVVHRSLAFSYGAKGDFVQAESYYSSTLELAPNDAFARADFANLLSKQGDKDRAVDQMAAAVKLKPQATALHVDLGWLAESKGDLKTAGKEFLAAVELSPKYPTLWSHLGNIYTKQGKVKDAEKAYKKALAIDPLHVEAKQGLEKLKSVLVDPAPSGGETAGTAAKPETVTKK